MIKEFVLYEQALDLKELGFNEPCFANYTVIPEDEIDWFTIPEQGITDKTSFGSSKNYNSKSFEEEGTISAPTFSQCFRWFREKHGLYYHIVPEFYRDGINFNWQILWYLPKEKWTNYVISNGTMLYGDNGEYPTQEDAELACLKKLIEIVKNK